MDDATLLDRMRGIEARHLGLAASSDRAARKAAADRLRSRLVEARSREADDTFSVSLPDPGLRAVFIALCRRYGMHPHRHARQRRSTLIVSAPASFYEKVFWPVFRDLSEALTDHFDALTARVLREVLDDESLVLTKARRDGDGTES